MNVHASPAARALLPALLVVAPAAAQAPAGDDGLWVRGVTISTHRSGQEWFGEAFAGELDELAGLGANWVAIHPYARIDADGGVHGARLDGAADGGLALPIRAAHERGLSILIVPHLAYWGTPFAWRGAIDFEPGPARERFFETYSDWILALVEEAHAADGFVLGSELDALAGDESRWRALIAGARARTAAHLTYAANWDAFERIGFWDALDAVGVQAYFPLSSAQRPERAELARGWRRVVARLRAMHERTGKPVVLTELGYDASPDAAREPWKRSEHLEGSQLAAARELQRECLEVALQALASERDWLRGAFLWKWFVGGSRREDFRLDSSELRAVLARAWRAPRAR